MSLQRGSAGSSDHLRAASVARRIVMVGLLGRATPRPRGVAQVQSVRRRLVEDCRKLKPEGPMGGPKIFLEFPPSSSIEEGIRQGTRDASCGRLVNVFHLSGFQKLVRGAGPSTKY
jgi:hypothetical protein